MKLDRISAGMLCGSVFVNVFMYFLGKINAGSVVVMLGFALIAVFFQVTAILNDQ